MAKYKLCPMCNTRNMPNVLECTECGNDLMGIRIMDDAIADQPSQREEKINNPSERLVRICDCGTENDLSARKCISCGEDISDIIPTRVTANVVRLMLSSIDNQCSLSLDCPSEHIVGREHELSDYLSSKPFVSRLHAKLTVTTDGVFIENLSQANGTYINNQKMTDGVAYKLCAGDEIGLGGFGTGSSRQNQAAYFVVHE